MSITSLYSTISALANSLRHSIPGIGSNSLNAGRLEFSDREFKECQRCIAEVLADKSPEMEALKAFGSSEALVDRSEKIKELETEIRIKRLGDKSIENYQLQVLKAADLRRHDISSGSLSRLKQLSSCLDDLFKLEALADHESVPRDGVRNDFLHKVDELRYGVSLIFSNLIQNGLGSKLDQFYNKPNINNVKSSSLGITEEAIPSGSPQISKQVKGLVSTLAKDVHLVNSIFDNEAKPNDSVKQTAEAA